MTGLQRRGGFTLTELLISLGILMVIVVSAGSVFLSAMETYALNKQLQDDQYNARMALLSISRDAHKSVSAEAAAGTLAFSGPAGRVVYDLSGGELRRGGEPLTEEGSLTGFAATVDGGRLTVTVNGRHNLELTTQVMLSRIIPI